MRSHEKIRVLVREVKDKPWVYVEIPGGEWVPSFEDLFRIVRAIVYCEKQKYAPQVADPGAMVARFLERCVDLADAEYKFAWSRLCAEFELPDRAGPKET